MHRWQAIASYNYGDAEGNSNADSSVSLQADFPVTDPRSANYTGRLPGTINHLVKLLGSYNWDMGIKVGATYRWNSGLIQSRFLQEAVPELAGFPGSTIPPYEFAGFINNWVVPGAVGTFESPSWSVFDIRVQYNHLFGKIGTEFFVDVFNVFNDQSIIRLNPYSSAPEFGQPLEFVPPRRFFLGVRASF